MIVSRRAPLADVLEVGAYQHQSVSSPCEPRPAAASRRRARPPPAGFPAAAINSSAPARPPPPDAGGDRETRQHHEPLVDARVVLIDAAAERVEASVDSEVASGSVKWRTSSGSASSGRRGGSARRRCSGTPPPAGRSGARSRRAGRTALLVDELHQAPTCSSTSASRSMSDGLRLSVTATSRTSIHALVVAAERVAGMHSVRAPRDHLARGTRQPDRELLERRPLGNASGRPSRAFAYAPRLMQVSPTSRRPAARAGKRLEAGEARASPGSSSCSTSPSRGGCAARVCSVST